MSLICFVLAAAGLGNEAFYGGWFGFAYFLVFMVAGCVLLARELDQEGKA